MIYTYDIEYGLFEWRDSDKGRVFGETDADRWYDIYVGY